MRLKINFTCNSYPVPNDRSIVLSWLHEVLGQNQVHDKESDYSVSSIMGGTFKGKTIEFPEGGWVIVSSNDDSLLGKVALNCFKHDLGYGMKFESMQHISEEIETGWNNFFTLTPIVLRKRNENGGRTFITHEDKEFSELLLDRLKAKLLRLDSSLDVSQIQLKIDDHSSHRTQWTNLHESKIIGSLCLVSIKCNRDVGQMIYNFGLGNLTGSGYGSICLVQNKSMYRFKLIGERKMV
jgi:CRISPR-associated endoribonuclease Cas6